MVEGIVENYLVPLERIGVKNTFAASGPYLDLLEKNRLSAGHIADAVKAVVQRKA